VSYGVMRSPVFLPCSFSVLSWCVPVLHCAPPTRSSTTLSLPSSLCLVFISFCLFALFCLVIPCTCTLRFSCCTLPHL